MLRVTIFYEALQEWGAAALERFPAFAPEDPAARAALAESLEATAGEIRAAYPEGLLGALSALMEAEGDIAVRRATPDMPEYGLSEAVLAETDVLVWWSHIANDWVSDAAALRVCRHVQAGMGLIALHSSHQCKPLRYLLGSSLTIRWREGDFSRVWTVAPDHPIARGVPEYFELAQEEMYGEPFDIPAPDELVFLSWFAGGEVFRSGCTWKRGWGRIFYFQPGHETNGAYHDPNVRRILVNAVRWAHSGLRRADFGNPEITCSPEELRRRSGL